MKYVVIVLGFAALLCAAILGTGGQLDLSTGFAVIVASCLPAGMAYEYRRELWPARETEVAQVPTVATTPAPSAFVRLRAWWPGLFSWHRPASSVFAPTVIER